MSASDLLAAPAASRRGTVPVRLAVAWQHPFSRLISPIGWLDWDGLTYRFRYVQAALHTDGFRPLIGFPDLRGDYASTRLFPVFAQRVMSARRPDYESYLDRLDLDRDSSPMEILGRSQGRRAGDTLQLFTVPAFDDDGRTAYSFLVNGVRHAIDDNQDADRRLSELSPGESLRLKDDPENEVNRCALITTSSDGVQLGWVPDLLLDYVHLVRDSGNFTLTVEHVNPPGTAPHMRLLARLSGQAPPGSRAFDGPKWTLLGST